MTGSPIYVQDSLGSGGLVSQSRRRYVWNRHSRTDRFGKIAISSLGAASWYEGIHFREIFHNFFFLSCSLSLLFYCISIADPQDHVSLNCASVVSFHGSAILTLAITYIQYSS